ncbi:histidine kinase dimerization/phosphoacceptor domain-containing protein, partial [Saccharopolyspora sp. NPDC002686]|uniref:histidine kinase dimerization/phosphoacceptor domain-containing protein n=1 Tax=Saccharopolyspora sp. NPDC002686 TaxID=3154541 RepID=UPI003334943B
MTPGSNPDPTDPAENPTRSHYRAKCTTRKDLPDRRSKGELHDVLGHHISLINVQAGAALHRLDADPEQA